MKEEGKREESQTSNIPIRPRGVAEGVQGVRESTEMEHGERNMRTRSKRRRDKG